MPSIDALNWEHLRVFLATMRTGSLRAAADSLKLSHPTARRRLGALEEQLGLQLFERRRDGLHPTVEADALHTAAEEVERAVHALGRIAQAADPALRGPIRVTAPDIVGTELLMPDFAVFQRRWPDIDLRVDVSYQVADLDKREADVAIRALPAGNLPAQHLTGRKAATSYQAVYGEGEAWIGWQGEALDRPWIRATAFPDLPIRGGFNDPVLQRGACAAGLGLSMLPCFYAEPMLKRRSKPRPHFDLWVLVHPDLRRSPRLRVFRDFIVDALKRHRARLEGLPETATD
ncbi:MAG: LysR family transcriptional regulator [Nannocystaceae bacterium]|nr:LysR family transcriptional regulator [Nannocystaceae bacterium]